jgi:hypothetical protein
MESKQVRKRRDDEGEKAEKTHRLHPPVIATSSSVTTEPSGASSPFLGPYTTLTSLANSLLSSISPAIPPYPVVAGSPAASAIFWRSSGGGGSPGTPCARLMRGWSGVGE